LRPGTEEGRATRGNRRWRRRRRDDDPDARL